MRINAKTIPSPEQVDTLEPLRQSIDNIDGAIFAMLAERFKITDRVGYYKAQQGLNSKDASREALQLQRVAALAQQHGLDTDFCQSYLQSVIDQVVKNHGEIAARLRTEHGTVD